MLRLHRVAAAALAASLLSLPAAAQPSRPPRPVTRPGLTAAVLEGSEAALHRLLDGLRRLYDDIHGTIDPDGHS